MGLPLEPLTVLFDCSYDEVRVIIIKQEAEKRRSANWNQIEKHKDRIRQITQPFECPWDYI